MTRYLIACAALLTACNNRTAEQQLIKDVKPAISWVAALQFAGEEWLADRVPRPYVRDATEAGAKDLQDALKRVDASPARKELRDVVRRELEVSKVDAERFKEAVDKNDRAAAFECVRRFAAASDALQRLQRKAESAG